MKKVVKQILLYIIIMSFILILAGCGKNNDTNILKEKIDSEISYLERELLDMLNRTNNLSFKNYIVSAEQIESTKDAGGNLKEGSNTQSDSSSQEGQSSEGGSNSSNGSSEESSSTSSSDKNNLNYKMEYSDVLSNNRKPDWKNLKIMVQELYTSWANIILDLYKININNEDILNFGTDLDLLTQVIKKEDKQLTLINLAKLYSYLPKYATSFLDAKKVNILKTKSNILNSYALIEMKKPEEVKKELILAEQAFMPIINNVEHNNHHQYNINKAYVLIKELQNSINDNQIEIFYIKYRNLMEELNIIQE
ncbi:MAG: hypothetical protein HFJ53_06955 [Clostridia bacterium]|jgi:hypothetical protein|nr:hypothetical protein [Clostridia bacterium]